MRGERADVRLEHITTTTAEEAAPTSLDELAAQMLTMLSGGNLKAYAAELASRAKAREEGGADGAAPYGRGVCSAAT